MKNNHPRGSDGLRTQAFGMVINSRMSHFSTQGKFITNKASNAHKYQLSSPKNNLAFVPLCDRRGKNL
jgi:hypothetical protein